MTRPGVLPVYDHHLGFYTAKRHGGRYDATATPAPTERQSAPPAVQTRRLRPADGRRLPAGGAVRRHRGGLGAGGDDEPAPDRAHRFTRRTDRLCGAVPRRHQTRPRQRTAARRSPAAVHLADARGLRLGDDFGARVQRSKHVPRRGRFDPRTRGGHVQRDQRRLRLQRRRRGDRRQRLLTRRWLPSEEPVQ